MTTTKQQRMDLDARLDAGIPTSLPHQERNTATLHLLRTIEQHWRQVERIRQTHGDAVCEVRLDVAREATHLCLKWIFDQIHDVQPLKLPVITSTKDVSDWSAIIKIAERYAEVCDAMGVLWLGKVDSRNISDSEIELLYTPKQRQYEAAQWMWRSQSAPEVPWPLDAIAILQQTVSGLNADDIDHRTVMRLDIRVIKRFHDNIRAVSESLWQLPGSMVIGPFSTTDFKEFWVALRTIIAVHKLLFNAVAERHNQAAIPVLTKGEWTQLLTNLSGLDQSKVSAIIDYLTYDYALIQKSGDKNHKSEAICLPFMPLAPDLLAVSCFLVMNSSAERNMFDLLSAQQGTTYDDLKKAKEEQWSADLANRFHKYGLHAVDQKIYPNEKNPLGDIDLFVFDKANRLGIVVQLKWLLMDRIKSGHIEEGERAFDQAKRAIRWIRENSAEAARKLEVDEDSLNSCQLLSLAVIKESILGGFAIDPEVPILNGIMFDVLIDITKGDLSKIWKIAFTDKSFLPVEHRDFVVMPGFAPVEGLPFNGIRFRRTQLDLPKTGRQWDPKTALS